MRGVKFGEYHTVGDWGLILNAKKMDPPTPKYVKVSVDGRDGDIDLSRTLTGEMKYENRSASFTFIITEGTYSDRAELINTIVNIIHGQELQIIEPDDLEHYLVGECSVEDIKVNNAYGTFTVTADCEPYRYSIYEVNRVIALSTTEADVVLTNTGTKTVMPTITVDGSVNLTIGGASVSLESGTYQLTALSLKSGNTTVTVNGSGTVTFTYREAVI